MLKKTLAIATLGTAVAALSFAGKADAADPVLGALIGGGIGAAIGHDVNRHHGGAVGGVVGALIGSSIAADSNRYYAGDRYYDDGYYAPSYGAYYAPPPVYYAPPPAYYAPYGAPIVYSSGPAYRYRGGYRDHRWRDGYRYR